MSAVQEQPTSQRTSANSRPGRGAQRGGTRPPRLPWRYQGRLSAAATALLVLLLTALWEMGTALQWWSETILPAPSVILSTMVDLFGTQQFWADAARTCVEIGLSFGFGGVLGLLAGVAFWRAPLIGRVFEPYLVSFYAVPLVLFYPLMIVLVGINAWSVIILATVMAAIPMALNTWVGLMGLPPAYLKLGRALQCGPRQTLLRIALPGAAPFLIAGLRLGAVYALIGATAMEFVTAKAGLGFRIRYLYEAFDTVTMFAYIVVVFALSLVLTAVLAVSERLLLRGREGQ